MEPWESKLHKSSDASLKLELERSARSKLGSEHWLTDKKMNRQVNACFALHWTAKHASHARIHAFHPDMALRLVQLKPLAPGHGGLGATVTVKCSSKYGDLAF